MHFSTLTAGSYVMIFKHQDGESAHEPNYRGQNEITPKKEIGEMHMGVLSVLGRLLPRGLVAMIFLTQALPQRMQTHLDI